VPVWFAAGCFLHGGGHLRFLKADFGAYRIRTSVNNLKPASTLNMTKNHPSHSQFAEFSIIFLFPWLLSSCMVIAL
ncbi:hypothetical protein COCVIDRAFT_86747, partial [Bipolaris victoriae FI3]